MKAMIIVVLAMILAGCESYDQQSARWEKRYWENFNAARGELAMNQRDPNKPQVRASVDSFLWDTEPPPVTIDSQHFYEQERNRAIRESHRY